MSNVPSLPIALQTGGANENKELDGLYAGQLLGVCADLLHDCSKLIGRINPAVGSIVRGARDEALAGLYEYWSDQNLSSEL